MKDYLIRRLILLPVTLFAIILINFVIVNLAPGEPSSYTSVSLEGATKKEGQNAAEPSDLKYLQFREHYGLTLPILLNTDPFIPQQQLLSDLEKLVRFSQTNEGMSFKDYENLRRSLGDSAKFVMPKLLSIINNSLSFPIQEMGITFFVRGATQQAILGTQLTEKEKQYNAKIAADNNALRKHLLKHSDPPQAVEEKIRWINQWYAENKEFYHFEPGTLETVKIFFFDTRIFKYFSRVLTLDFGTLRNDNNKLVIDEVIKRLPISLTLSVTPMIISFVLCILFGFWMAYERNGFIDRSLNITFLILFAIPVFVAAPFILDKLAINHYFPFTQTPIPIYGFTSPLRDYREMTSSMRLLDILQHIALPIIVILYGSFAAQSRLTRSQVLEVLNNDYIRTARAKGLSEWTIAWKHVGRPVSIILVTALAGSLGVLLGGSLIVETIFEINGFGKFFYDGILNRDYNVIMFSTLIGSFLTLFGYLLADITYVTLDPRVSF